MKHPLTNVHNDFECLHCNDKVDEYVIEKEGGKFDVTQYQLDEKIIINIKHAHIDSISNMNSIGKIRVDRFSFCLMGSVNFTMGEKTFSLIPGYGIVTYQANERVYLDFPAREYLSLNLGIMPGGLDLPNFEGDPSPEVMLDAIRERFRVGEWAPFQCSFSLSSVIMCLTDEIMSNGLKNEKILRMLLAQILHIMYNHENAVFVGTKCPKNVEKIDRLCVDMISDLSSPLNLDRFCLERRINKFTFIRQFKSRYGMTPYCYHREQRLCLAASRMICSDIDVLSLANDAGFESQSKFSDAFKKSSGYSPTDFRKMMNEFGKQIE